MCLRAHRERGFELLLRLRIVFGRERLRALRHRELELRIAHAGAHGRERAAGGLPARIDCERLAIGRDRLLRLTGVALRVGALDEREHLGQPLGARATGLRGRVLGLDAEHDVVLGHRDLGVRGRERFLRGGERTLHDLGRAREQLGAHGRGVGVARDSLREVVREERILARVTELLVTSVGVAAPRIHVQRVELALLREQLREQSVGLRLQGSELFGGQLRRGRRGRLRRGRGRSRPLMRRLHQARQQREHEHRGRNEQGAREVLPKRRARALVDGRCRRRRIGSHGAQPRLDRDDGLFVLCSGRLHSALASV